MDDKSLDFFRETINTGVREATVSLSESVKSPVSIEVPNISVLTITQAACLMRQETEKRGIYILQDFQGVLDGRAIWVCPRGSAIALVNYLSRGAKDISSLTNIDIATLQEIGSILIGSYVGAVSAMMDGSLEFKLPQVCLETVESYFREQPSLLGDFETCIVVTNKMAIPPEVLDGFFFILLTFQYFHKLASRVRVCMEERVKNARKV